ncbi:SDR family NAD(P)-dependent oxidoreductase [Halioxenophilus aromaticivorans]|uniref:SDR family NAD(P)-dependent oxidoreductase n=1 Tax=Halioxenophilus aromaticivorans TaxID=1306992 RepID=A0AAV3TX75_9ALTE
MNLEIEGRMALVTGAAGGLGKATAKRLADEGVRLFLTDTDEDAVASCASDLHESVVGYSTADLTDISSINNLAGSLTELGGADILIHLAGITGAKGDPLEMDDDAWMSCWNTNFMSAVRLCRKIVPTMVEKKWGRVVLTVSENAVQPYPDEAVYNASKAALLSYTKALSLPYGPKGVLVNAVMPAFIESPMTDGMMDSLAEEKGISREEAVDQFLENERPYLSLKRRGRADEVAVVVALLASDIATFTNGSAWRADGGAVAAINI